MEAMQSIPPEVGRFRQASLVVGVTFLALSGAGGFFSPERFFRSYLIAYVFWFGVALGCLAIVMLHHMTGGAWGLVTRRLLESATRTLPYMAILFLPVALGTHSLYVWARPEEVIGVPLLEHKSSYLNVPFFLARALFYFAVWCGISHLLNRWSLDQDRAVPAGGSARRLQMLSAPGLVLYGLTATFASIDWVMSLEPEWFSTIFGVLFMGGQALSALAFAIAVTVLLSKRKPLSDVIAPSHLHDLGKLMLAFVMLWAYFAFSQFLITWAGNLPEEIGWYVHRLHGGWQWVGLALILFHFALPFLLLLSRDLKRSARRLAFVAAAVIVMRFVDLFWMIAPEFQDGSLSVHWMDVAAPVGVGGIWLALYAWQLQRRPLLPLGDPGLGGVLNHGHQ